MPARPLEPSASSPLVHLPEAQTKLPALVRNPLFLVIVTWLVMAAMLVVEIVAGN